MIAEHTGSLARGDVVGRYIVLGRRAPRRGSAMYTGYDRILDRRVLLAIVDARPDADAHARVLDHARALARLDHSQVARVHDVGEVAGRVWLAIELVEGQTLAEWARSGVPRRRLLGESRAAGEGLAALHAAGTMHAEVTADRVIVGDDGRVRWIDFALEGPESADATADQAAFCRMTEALLDARGGVPRWLRPVLARGRDGDPRRRWPSLADLLDAWSSTRRRARIRAWAAVVALVLVSASLIAIGRHVAKQRARAACAVEAASIESTWNDDVRDRVHAGLLATDAANAEATFAKIEPWLDDAAARWREVAEQACVRIEVERAWDENTSRLALACLGRQRDQLVDRTRRFIEADALAVKMAGQWAARSSVVEQCLDPDVLARIQTPMDPAHADGIAMLSQLGAQVQRLMAEERYADAYLVAHARVPLAVALGEARSIAACRVTAGEASMMVGRNAEARDLLREAYFGTIAQGRDESATEPAQMLVYVFGVDFEDRDRALIWARHAEALLRRLPDSDGVRDAAIWMTLGAVHLVAGEYEEAITWYGRAHEAWEGNFGSDNQFTADVLAGIAMAREGLGEIDRAADLFERSLAGHERSGPMRVETAAALERIGEFRARHDDTTGALQAFERARTIREAATGDDPITVLPATMGLVRVHVRRGEIDRADELLRRALPVATAGGPLGAIAAGELLTELGRVRAARGEWDAAIDAYEGAIARLERMDGRIPTLAARARVGLGAALATRGRCRDGIESIERGIATLDRSGASKDELAAARLVLADVLWSTGRDRSRARLLGRQAADELAAASAPLRAAAARQWLAERRDERG